MANSIELLKLCYLHAQYSPDNSNQNGAIVAERVGEDDYIVVSYGINRFLPHPRIDDGILQNRALKLQYIEHAERSAIYSAAQLEPTRNKSLFTCWAACTDCARAIVLSGIKEVITHKQRFDLTPERWRNSVDIGLKMIEDNNVQLTLYDGKLNTVPVIVNGELLSL